MRAIFYIFLMGIFSAGASAQDHADYKDMLANAEAILYSPKVPITVKLPL